MNQPRVFLLSCGDELLFGHTVDTNSAWLAQECTLIGWRVVGHRTVGDVTSDIVAAFREAASRADAVILTGGLGPTEDDRTRHALAGALGVQLEENTEAIGEIEAMFKRFNHPMGKINRVQALIPRGAERIKNTNGTAPGIRAELNGAVIFALPGVPREMREMFTLSIRPELAGRPSQAHEVLRRLHVFGMGESDIGDAIKPLMGEGGNPEVGTAVAEGVITVRIYAKGDSAAQAEAVAARAEAEIRAVLGNHIFGSDGETLPGATVAALRSAKAALTLAESCSGGMLSGMIVDVPGASDVFMEGVVSYSNAAKTRRLGVDPALIEKHGAVSREVAAAMAEGSIRQSGVARRPMYSLAITGIAGPDGGTPEKPVGTVWIACSRLLANGDGVTRTMLYNTVTDRHGIRLRASHAALDLLRRTLLDIPPARAFEERRWSPGHAES